MTRNEYELLPNPVFLMESMRHIGYNLKTALADIIDNSIAANASLISVSYRWNEGNPWIAILDNGCGMSFDKLLEAMRFGGMVSPNQERNTSDLGRYGLGLKTASLSQCKRLTVISKQNNTINGCTWDIEELSKLSDPKWSVLRLSESELKEDPSTSFLVQKLNQHDSGTIVLWQHLDAILENNKGSTENHFLEEMNSASDHIGLVFHRFFVMEHGSKIIKIDFNGTTVQGFNPFGMAIPARQELTEEVLDIEGKKITIQPFVLPHHSKVSKQEYEKTGGDDGYLHNQGFYVYRNRRLIISATWFHIIRKTELTKLIRIRIDIPNSLDHLWQLDIKKSQATPPAIVLMRLRELLPGLIERGKRPYTKRGSRAISDIVHIWRREFENGNVSYVINEEHPLVQCLAKDEQGNIDPQKLSCLRIISDSFPKDAFHVDINSDSKTSIVPVVEQDELEKTIRNLISSLHLMGMDQSLLVNNMSKTEFPISEKRLKEIIEEECNG